MIRRADLVRFLIYFVVAIAAMYVIESTFP